MLSGGRSCLLAPRFVVPAALVFVTVVHRLHLCPLLRREQEVHAIKHHRARLVISRTSRLDLVNLLCDDEDVRRVLLNRAGQHCLEAVELLAGVPQAPDTG